MHSITVYNRSELIIRVTGLASQTNAFVKGPFVNRQKLLRIAVPRFFRHHMFVRSMALHLISMAQN